MFVKGIHIGWRSHVEVFAQFGLKVRLANIDRGEIIVPRSCNREEESNGGGANGGAEVVQRLPERSSRKFGGTAGGSMCAPPG